MVCVFLFTIALASALVVDEKSTNSIKKAAAYTLPIKPLHRQLIHQEDVVTKHPAVMKMSYPQVTGLQNSKYADIKLLGNTVEYYTTVLIGTPGQPFTLQLDTGSAITALPSVRCVGCYNYNPKYNSSQSSTSNVIMCTDEKCTSKKCNDDNTCSFSVSYGDKSTIQGGLISDVVAFPLDYKERKGLARGGNTTIELLTSTAYGNTPVVFGAMTSQSAGFQLHGVDGIMGFSFDSSSLTCVPNCASLFMDSIVKAHGVSDIFSMSLQPIRDNSQFNTVGGSLTIGGINSDIVKNFSEIHYTPVLRKPYYSVLLGDVTIGDITIESNSEMFERRL